MTRDLRRDPALASAIERMKAGLAAQGYPPPPRPDRDRAALDYALPPEADPVEALALDVARLRGAVARLAWIVAIMLAAYLPLAAALLWAVS